MQDFYLRCVYIVLYCYFLVKGKSSPKISKCSRIQISWGDRISWETHINHVHHVDYSYVSLFVFRSVSLVTSCH